MLHFYKPTFVLPLLATALAGPVLVDRHNTFNAPPGFNVTYESAYNSSLPRVVIFATGGTIAGSSASASDTTGYAAGVVGIEALVKAVPQLLNVSNIVGSQLANVGSTEITGKLQLKMSKLANEILCSDDSTTDGLVITHGTDTLEETAFFMDLTVNCEKPVVLVGAMRPSTAISADGPANILEGVTLAATPDARGRGALIALNDRVASAYYSQKTNANNLDTFKALEQGFLGGFLNYKPFFYYPAVQPTFKQYFDVSKVDTLPQVNLLTSYIDQDVHDIDHAIASGAKGIVIAGPGSGSTPASLAPYIEGAIAQGVPVVVATRTGSGAGDPKSDFRIEAGFVNPTHARIQLQLALATGLNQTQIRTGFEATLSNYVL